MVSVKDLISALGEELHDYVNKANTVFIFDETIIEAWIEEKGDKEQVLSIFALIDLIIDLLRQKQYVQPIIIPIDVLLELEKKGKSYVNNKEFIDAINTFALIKEINPDKEYTGGQSVSELANLLEKQGYSKTIVILTLKKDRYQKTEKIIPLKPSRILLTFILMNCWAGDLMTEDLKRVYQTWLGKISGNNS